MKVSNFCKASALAVGLAVMAAPITAEAISTNSMVEKVVKYVSKKGSSKMCIKGSFFSGVVSLRSFDGALCGANKETAAFAVAACYGSNVEGFRDSKCFNKAKGKLGLTGSEGETEIISKAVAVMAQGVKKAGSEVAKLACTKADSLPGAAKDVAMTKCGT